MTPRGLVAVVVGAVGLLAASATASAVVAGSDLVVDADPGPGSVVVSPPDRISVAFDEAVVDASVRLFDEAGQERAVAMESTIGTVVEGTPELLGSGRYLLAWEVTGEVSGRVSGAYAFAVDPSGTGAIAIDREVAGSDTAETVRILGSVLAGVGWVLLAGSLFGAALDPDRGSRRASGWAGALMAGGAALAFVGTGGGPNGSSLTSAMDTTEGRAWMVVLMASLAVPYIVLRWASHGDAPRQIGWRLIAVVALAIAGAGLLVGVAGEGVPPVLAAAVGLVGAASTTAAMLERRTAAIVGAVVVIGLSALAVAQTREYSFVHRADLGPILLEVAIDPAQRGVNELHLYGFDAGGGLAELGETTAWVTHVPTAVGPMEIPLLRAGPNHFLTYAAELPLAGTWEIEMHTSTAGTSDLVTTAIVELQ